MTRNTAFVATRLTPDEARALAVLADHHDRSLAGEIRVAIRDRLALGTIAIQTDGARTIKTRSPSAVADDAER